MGGCAPAGDTGKNTAPDMTQYVNLKIGESFTHPTYCQWCTESEVNCGDNKEFVRDGNGTGTCKCQGLCNDGCCRKKCTRTNYSGTVDLCCQNGGADYYKDSKGVVRTCDPTYRATNWKNQTCDKSMNAYCKQGNNLFTTACRQWVTTYQPTGSLSTATGNGSVDDVLIDVCNRPENADRKECGCITAANLIRDEFPDSNNIPAQCLVNSCANTPEAYRTSDQLQPCNVVNCEISVNDLEVIQGDDSTFNLDFAQECSNTSPPATPGTTPTPATPGTTPSPSPNSNGNNDNDNTNTYIYIILGILALVLIGVILYFIFRKK